MEDSKTFIIVGHYGSGKTEFAVNLVYKLLAQGRKVAIADLDIVNPYFRSREMSEQLESEGVKVVSNNFGNEMVDAPAVSAAVIGCLSDRVGDNVIDVGGDAVGARVLGRFASYVKRGYEMLMVTNFNRYQTQRAEDVLDYIRSIEETSTLQVTGLVNNTHYLRATALEDVLHGDEQVRELSRLTGLPVKYCSYISSLDAQLCGKELAGERFPLELKFRPEWFMT